MLIGDSLELLTETTFDGFHRCFEFVTVGVACLMLRGRKREPSRYCEGETRELAIHAWARRKIVS